MKKNDAPVQFRPSPPAFAGNLEENGPSFSSRYYSATTRTNSFTTRSRGRCRLVHVHNVKENMKQRYIVFVYFSLAAGLYGWRVGSFPHLSILRTDTFSGLQETAAEIQVNSSESRCVANGPTSHDPNFAQFYWLGLSCHLWPYCWLSKKSKAIRAPRLLFPCQSGIAQRLCASSDLADGVG